MLENPEFWCLFVPIIAGIGVEMKYLIGISEKISNVTERITKLEAETRAEFDKCRMHACSTKWGEEI